MKDFLYKIESKKQFENIEHNLFYLDSNLEPKIRKVEEKYSIYIKKDDFEALNLKSDKIIVAEEKFFNIEDKKISQITIENEEVYDYLLKEIREKEIKTYEEDISLEHRYLIEKNISIGEYVSNSLKYISLDIETVGEEEKQEIVLISVQSSDNKLRKVYCDMSKIKEEHKINVVEHKYEEFELEICENEKELLEKFQGDIFEFKPQVLIGWNVIDFDFKVIRERMRNFSIPFKFNENQEKECNLRIQKDFFRDSTIDCSGLLVFDVIQLLKTNYIAFPDYKLNTVAKHVLRDEKIDLEFDDDDSVSIENKIAAIENLLAKDPVKLIEYNFKDSLLTSEILEKLNLLDLMCKRSQITGVPLNRVKSPIATLDVMYLKELHKKNYLAYSHYNFTGEGPIGGAYVIDPTKGFYEDVFVFDFKSLYPSIIMTFNLDPYSYDMKNGEIVAPNNAKFSREQGILPELIFTLYKERDIAKKENDLIKSHALKITMNSFYGAVASPKSRLHNRDIGEAITAFGRNIILKSKEFIEGLGHKVIYGDTDSVFVKLNKDFAKLSFEEKKKEGQELEAKLNEFFANWVEEDFKQKNFLNIELEKLYSKFFIATKKRYVGFDEFTKKVQFVGLEAVRGDWTQVAKDFQIELVDLIFKGSSKNEICEFIAKKIKDLKDGKYNDKLVYRKRITKPLEEYTKTTPPHVKAARELDDFQGRLVEYVMLETGPKHISLIDVNSFYDYEHYVDKQLRGVSDELLDAINVKFDEALPKKQKSLDSFFG